MRKPKEFPAEGESFTATIALWVVPNSIYMFLNSELTQFPCTRGQKLQPEFLSDRYFRSFFFYI